MHFGKYGITLVDVRNGIVNIQSSKDRYLKIVPMNNLNSPSVFSITYAITYIQDFLIHYFRDRELITASITSAKSKIQIKGTVHFNQQLHIAYVRPIESRLIGDHKNWH